ncbi:MAG: META domain-containing protein [Arthrobacter sp.]|uniref:META domain-containing protein n=1 Tax=Arthrobacter sp. TaxID=1667 RepID=UPI0034705DB0
MSDADDVAGRLWGDDGRPGRPWLAFSEDGRVHGSDGCNMLSGSWRSVGDAVVVGPMMTTRRYCEGVDTWLSGVESVRVDGGELLAFGADGARIGALRASAPS